MAVSCSRQGLSGLFARLTGWSRVLCAELRPFRARKAHAPSSVALAEFRSAMTSETCPNGAATRWGATTRATPIEPEPDPPVRPDWVWQPQEPRGWREKLLRLIAG